MGDKGGKKNKEKSQKQGDEKQRQKDKSKADKQPKSKLNPLADTCRQAGGLQNAPLTSCG